MHVLTNRPQILLSTAYLPPIEHFAYLASVPEVYVEQFETYPKQTFRNRCQIYAECGKMSLSIPVKKINGNNTKTNEIEISYEERWQLNHWRAIESAYIASPFFLYYKDELYNFYNTKSYKNLFEFNTNLMLKLCKLIGIKTRVNYTNEFILKPENTVDMRFAINPKTNPTLSHFTEYIQVFGNRHGFIPNLSIIDLLFNMGPDTKNYIENINV